MLSLLVCFMLAFSAQLHAQTTAVSQPQPVELHLLKRTDPVYPPIAKAARVSGPVTFKLTVGPDGHVLHATLISGPPLLAGAAVECVQEWIYEPRLQEGKPVETTTFATVTFSNGLKARPDEKMMDKFWPLERTCMEDIASKAAPAKQADQCQKAAEVASTFDPTERYEVRRNAFVSASSALLHNHQNPQALDYATKAVDIAEQGHLDGAPAAAAYAARAQAEATTGNLAAASQDLEIAEKYQQNAVDNMSPKAVEPYRRATTGMLKSLLTLHAEVLTAQGKTSEAQAKAARASSL